MPQASRYTFCISELLGLGNEMRVQNPTLRKTAGKNPRWYIRPYVDRLERDGSITRVKERVYLGSCEELPKRKAQTEIAKVMRTLNDRRRVLQAQIGFGELLDEYEQKYVLVTGNLSVSTQGKYRTHIKNHIRPAFENLMLAEIGTKRIEDWLAEKAKAGLSWATRMDLRNLMSGIFTQAERWGYWQAKNPAANVIVGKQRAVREKCKLTDEQTRSLLESLPEDVRRICMVALFCTLRISEVLGLQWKHIDFQAGLIRVRQRYYRGDLDDPKTRKAKRDVPMGRLSDDLSRLYPGCGHEDEFVFSVKTHLGKWKEAGVCRDDRDISRYFLRPAAKKLGIYFPGFGFHSFRREAITSISAEAGVGQAMSAAGHTKADMSQEYTLADHTVQERAVRAHQDRILGKFSSAAESTENRNADSIGLLWATLTEGLDDELKAIINEILSLSGGPVQTRTADLYRVKVAL